MRPVVVLAGAALLAAPIVASLLLRPGPRAEAAPAPVPARAAPASDHPSFPAPPDGAVVFSRELGSDALAFGVVPEAAGIAVQASLVGPQGRGVSGRSVAFTVQGRTKEASACGPGCYRAAFPVSGVRSSPALSYWFLHSKWDIGAVGFLQFEICRALFLDGFMICETKRMNR